MPLGTVASCRPFLILFRESTSLQVLGILGDHLCLSRKQMVSPVSLFEVGRGQSQLVPRWAPYNPRLFTPRECARIMGFPESYQLGDAMDRRQCKALYPLYLGIQMVALDLWPHNDYAKVPCSTLLQVALLLSSTKFMMDARLLFVHTWKFLKCCFSFQPK